MAQPPAPVESASARADEEEQGDEAGHHRHGDGQNGDHRRPKHLVQEIAELLRRHRFSGLPVVDEDG
ncbi:hypothetical protein [Streptomyces sp. NPDC096153]|uniref:hypothetical protein n=1 Tax=Streptomyces sp. NPDC096153 TaxID=3155548 RepID=UPI00331A03DF